MNDYLTASNENLSTVLDTTLDKMRGGDDQGQRPGHDAAAGRAEPRRAAARRASCGGGRRDGAEDGARSRDGDRADYDPNLIEQARRLREDPRDAAPCAPPSPLLNRATQGLYAPGSTFKVVTAVGRRSTRGKFTPDSTFDDPGYCVEYGKQGLQHCRPERARAVYGGVDARSRRSSTRSTPSSATSARRSGRKRSSTTRSGSASTRRRRSRRRRTSAPERPLQERASCSARGPGARSTPAGSRSARSGCWSRRCRWRWSRPGSRTAAS